jgi:hypothetical protein
MTSSARKLQLCRCVCLFPSSVRFVHFSVDTRKSHAAQWMGHGKKSSARSRTTSTTQASDRSIDRSGASFRPTHRNSQATCAKAKQSGEGPAHPHTHFVFNSPPCPPNGSVFERDDRVDTVIAQELERPCACACAMQQDDQSKERYGSMHVWRHRRGRHEARSRKTLASWTGGLVGGARQSAEATTPSYSWRQLQSQTSARC